MFILGVVLLHMAAAPRKTLNSKLFVSFTVSILLITPVATPSHAYATRDMMSERNMGIVIKVRVAFTIFLAVFFLGVIAG